MSDELGRLLLYLGAPTDTLESDLGRAQQLITKYHAKWQKQLGNLSLGGVAGNLNVEMVAAEAVLDRSLRQMKQRAAQHKIRVAIEVVGLDESGLSSKLSKLAGQTIKVKADLSELHALNKLLDVKIAHIQKTQQVFAKTVITPKVDLSGLHQLNKELDGVLAKLGLFQAAGRQGFSGGTLRLEIDSSGISKEIQKAIRKSFQGVGDDLEKEIAKGLKKGRKGGGIGGAITAIPQTVARGFYEGIGQTYARQLTQGTIKGIEQQFEMSIDRVGQRIGNNAANVGKAAGQRVIQRFGFEDTAALKAKMAKANEIIKDLVPEDILGQKLGKLENKIFKLADSLSRLRPLQENLSRLGDVGRSAAEFREIPSEGLKRRRAKKVAEYAQQIKTTPGANLDVPQEANTIVIASGGFAGAKGKSSGMVAAKLGNLLGNKYHVVPVNNTATDVSLPLQDAGIGRWLAEAGAKIAGHNLVSGVNPDAVRMAKLAQQYRQQYPDKKIRFAGFSAGGFAAHDALMLDRAAGNTGAKAVSIGTPIWGKNFASTPDFSGVLREGDGVKTLADRFKPIFGKLDRRVKTTPGKDHDLALYLSESKAQRAILDQLGSKSEPLRADKLTPEAFRVVSHKADAEALFEQVAGLATSPIKNPKLAKSVLTQTQAGITEIRANLKKAIPELKAMRPELEAYIAALDEAEGLIKTMLGNTAKTKSRQPVQIPVVATARERVAEAIATPQKTAAAKASSGSTAAPVSKIVEDQQKEFLKSIKDAEQKVANPAELRKAAATISSKFSEQYKLFKEEVLKGKASGNFDGAVAPAWFITKMQEQGVGDADVLLKKIAEQKKSAGRKSTDFHDLESARKSVQAYKNNLSNYNTLVPEFVDKNLDAEQTEKLGGVFRNREILKAGVIGGGSVLAALGTLFAGSAQAATGAAAATGGAGLLAAAAPFALPAVGVGAAGFAAYKFMQQRQNAAATPAPTTARSGFANQIAEIAGAERPVSKLSEAFFGLAGKAKLALGAFVGFQVGQFVISQFAGIAKETIALTGEFEALQLQIQASTGSLEGGRQRFGAIRSEARGLGISQSGALETAARIGGTTLGTELEGAPTELFTTQLNKIAKARGLNRSQVNGLSTAISQILGSPRVLTEELNQLRESGGITNARTIGANALGLSPQQFRKQLESPQGISSSKFVSAFLSQATSDSMLIEEAALDTQGSKIAKLQGAYESLQLVIGEGINPAFKAGLDTLTGGLDLLTKGVEIGSTVLIGLAVRSIPMVIGGLVNLGRMAVAAGVNMQALGTAIVGIGKMGAQIAALYAIGESIKFLSQSMKDAGEDTQRETAKIKKAFDELNGTKATVKLELPTNASDIQGEDWGQGFMLGVERILGDGIAGITNSFNPGSPQLRFVNQKEKEQQQQGDAIDQALSNVPTNLEQTGSVIGKAKQLNQVDLQLQQLSSQRSALFVTNPSDAVGLAEIDKQYRALYQSRNQLAQQISPAQAAVQQQLNQLKGEKDKLESLREKKQITAGEYTSRYDRITSAIKQVEQAQIELNKAIKSPLDDLAAYSRSLDRLAAKYEGLAAQFTKLENANKKGRNEREISGQTTAGESEYQASIDQQNLLIDRIQKTEAAIKAMISQLNAIDPKQVDRVLSNYGLNLNSTSAAEFNSVAQSTTDALDKEVLTRLGAIKQQQTDLDGFATSLSDARKDLYKKIRSENLEIEAYYKSIIQGIDRNDVQSQILISKIATARSRFQTALAGFGDSLADGFFNAITELLQTSQAEVENQAERARAKAQNQRTLSNTLNDVNLKRYGLTKPTEPSYQATSASGAMGLVSPITGVSLDQIVAAPYTESQGFNGRRTKPDGTPYKHNSLDIGSAVGVRAGTPVVAAGTGQAQIIDLREPGRANYGLGIKITLNDGTTTISQMHLNPDSVRAATGRGVGDRFPVTAGQALGNVENLRLRNTENHLHFRTDQNGKPVDSLQFFRRALTQVQAQPQSVQQGSRGGIILTPGHFADYQTGQGVSTGQAKVNGLTLGGEAIANWVVAQRVVAQLQQKGVAAELALPTRQGAGDGDGSAGQAARREYQEGLRSRADQTGKALLETHFDDSREGRAGYIPSTRPQDALDRNLAQSFGFYANNPKYGFPKAQGGGSRFQNGFGSTTRGVDMLEVDRLSENTPFGKLVAQYIRQKRSGDEKAAEATLQQLYAIADQKYVPKIVAAIERSNVGGLVPAPQAARASTAGRGAGVGNYIETGNTTGGVRKELLQGVLAYIGKLESGNDYYADNEGGKFPKAEALAGFPASQIVPRMIRGVVREPNIGKYQFNVSDYRWAQKYDPSITDFTPPNQEKIAMAKIAFGGRGGAELTAFQANPSMATAEALRRALGNEWEAARDGRGARYNGRDTGKDYWNRNGNSTAKFYEYLLKILRPQLRSDSNEILLANSITDSPFPLTKGFDIKTLGTDGRSIAEQNRQMQRVNSPRPAEVVQPANNFWTRFVDHLKRPGPLAGFTSPGGNIAEQNRQLQQRFGTNPKKPQSQFPNRIPVAGPPEPSGGAANAQKRIRDAAARENTPKFTDYNGSAPTPPSLDAAPPTPMVDAAQAAQIERDNAAKQQTYEQATGQYQGSLTILDTIAEQAKKDKDEADRLADAQYEQKQAGTNLARTQAERNLRSRRREAEKTVRDRQRDAGRTVLGFTTQTTESEQDSRAWIDLANRIEDSRQTYNDLAESLDNAIATGETTMRELSAKPQRTPQENKALQETTTLIGNLKVRRNQLTKDVEVAEAAYSQAQIDLRAVQDLKRSDARTSLGFQRRDNLAALDETRQSRLEVAAQGDAPYANNLALDAKERNQQYREALTLDRALEDIKKQRRTYQGGDGTRIDDAALQSQRKTQVERENSHTIGLAEKETARIERERLDAIIALNDAEDAAIYNSEERIKLLTEQIAVERNQRSIDRANYLSGREDTAGQSRLSLAQAYSERSRGFGLDTRSDDYDQAITSQQLDYSRQRRALNAQREAITGTGEDADEARAHIDELIANLEELNKVKLDNLADAFDPINQAISDSQKQFRSALGDFVSGKGFNIGSVFAAGLGSLSNKLLDSVTSDLFSGLYRSNKDDGPLDSPGQGGGGSILGSIFGLIGPLLGFADGDRVTYDPTQSMLGKGDGPIAKALKKESMLSGRRAILATLSEDERVLNYRENQAYERAFPNGILGFAFGGPVKKSTLNLAPNKSVANGFDREAIRSSKDININVTGDYSGASDPAAAKQMINAFRSIVTEELINHRRQRTGLVS
jgi:tape measure domain-containing protein